MAIKKWLIFFKAQASSFIATVVDFTVTIVLKQVLLFDVLLSSITGTISGGLVNFLIGRFWVFEGGREKKSTGQAIRYIIVWNGNLLLNGLGMYLLTRYSTIDYKVAKMMVSFTLGISYNYFMQKLFVFK